MKNKKLTFDEVKHVAKLANIVLDEAQLGDFQNKLSETLDYIDALKEIDTTGVLPTAQVTGTENCFRDDKITACFTQEETLKNAKKTHNGFFVAKVVWN